MAVKAKRAVTLIEVFIIVLVVSVLAAFAIPQYRNAQRNARNNEAEAMLKLIQHAEEMRRFETGNYIACADEQACNAALGLDLPVNRDWDYSANANGCAQAVDRFTGTVTWHISPGDLAPAAGTCP